MVAKMVLSRAEWLVDLTAVPRAAMSVAWMAAQRAATTAAMTE